MPSIHFLDVTNRDGVQTARTGLSKFGKVMVNFYLGRLGVAQSEIGFPFLFHEVPYVRACVALGEAGAFGDLRLSGWCRAVPADVASAVPLGLRHYNVSISTSDQMIAHKFRGRLDRAAIIGEMTAAVAVARDGGAETIGVNAEDGSRTDDGYLLEFAVAAREAGASRVRYCDTIGGDSPGRIRERFAKLASAVGIPVETHCHNDLGMAVANSVSGALGDLDAGQDAWVNTCVNGIGERAGNADLLSCILAFSYGFGISDSVSVGDRLDLSWARRFGLWAAHAFGQPLPPAWPGVGRNAFAHESGIHADGALKDRGNYELYDESVLGPFPADWYARDGRVVLTGEYGGKAGFRHVLEGLGVEVPAGEEDLVFSLVQLCASATGKPLTDDELRLIAGYPHQLALLFPGQLLARRFTSRLRGNAGSGTGGAGSDRLRRPREAGPRAGCGPEARATVRSGELLCEGLYLVRHGGRGRDRRLVAVPRARAAVRGGTAAAARRGQRRDRRGAGGRGDRDRLQRLARDDEQPGPGRAARAGELRVRAAQAALHDAGPGRHRGRRVHGRLPRVDLGAELGAVAHL